MDPDAIRQGDRLALSRALTAVENGDPAGQEVLAALFPHTGQSHLIGVTGAPGTGKSTLVNQLARAFRKSSKPNPAPKVAIIAVDPTSPFSGGALLGDRIRMQDLAGDKGIFIRSMASRGELGGLAHSTAAFATLLDGAGFDLIIIETVGAGQAEVDIARLAHTVLVVEAPGLGDEIQAIKAGILEIADVLVVNKADRPEAQNTARALQAMLEMAQSSGSLPPAAKHLRRMKKDISTVTPKEESGWQPPVRLVTATEGKGIGQLVDDIQAHQTYLAQSGLWQAKEAYRLQRDLDSLIRDALHQTWQESRDPKKYEAVLDQLIEKKINPLEAVALLI
ncbi:methylmalonyl Co-A mutase-associated GTPase MeaB [bacterium]|nr:methylmalonyl Co-A mutase-associated GTPase MeaB [bacterium]